MTLEESTKEHYFRINKSIDYIKAHLHADFSPDKLARHSNFSIAPGKRNRGAKSALPE